MSYRLGRTLYLFIYLFSEWRVAEILCTLYFGILPATVGYNNKL